MKCCREETKMKAHTASWGPIRAGPTWRNPRQQSAIMVGQTIVHVPLVLPRHLCMMHNQYGQHGQEKKTKTKQCVCSVQQCACFIYPSAGIHRILSDLALATFINWTICFLNDDITLMRSNGLKKIQFWVNYVNESESVS